MNNDLLTSLKIFINENGKDALDNTVSTGSFVYSNTDSKYITECEVLMICLTLGYHQKLIKSSQSERHLVKRDIVEYLSSNEGINLEICNRSLDILEAALFEMKISVEKYKKSPISSDEKIKKVSNDLDKEKQLNKEYAAIIIEKDEQINILNEEKNRLMDKKVNRKSTKSKIDETLVKTRRKFNTVVVLFIISFIAMCFIYSYMRNKNIELSYLYEQINDEYITLEKYFEDSKKIWTINVVDMKVGNANQNNQWITKPGVQLKATTVQYLNPVFTYNSPVTCYMTFFIKIINPKGEIERNNNSPDGYTFSRQYQIKKGQKIEFDPYGWRNSQGGAYYPGTWKIELWSEGFCLYSGDVILE